MHYSSDRFWNLKNKIPFISYPPACIVYTGRSEFSIIRNSELIIISLLESRYAAPSNEILNCILAILYLLRNVYDLF